MISTGLSAGRDVQHVKLSEPLFFFWTGQFCLGFVFRSDMAKADEEQLEAGPSRVKEQENETNSGVEKEGSKRETGSHPWQAGERIER